MEERIYIIIAKVLHGEASDEERRELDAWLAEDAKHREILAGMEAAWGDTDALFETPKFDTATAWEKVATRIAPSQTIAPKRSKTIAFPAWTKYSAAIAAILVIALFVFNPFRTETITIAAASDERMELPDHSIITLRKGSTFSYPKTFASGERHVKLEGEAYFEVTRNEAQPFVIDAQSVNVRVLGTTFNVRCTQSAADVAVTSGRVQVASQKEKEKTAILLPGKKAHYESGQLTEGTANGYEALWKNSELYFSNEPLSNIIHAIETVKDTAIQTDPRFTPQQLAQAVTVRFRNQSLEDMLTELCLITNCRWERRGPAYLVQPK